MGRGLYSIKKRGVENIDLIVADGLTGLENKIHQYFPTTYFQIMCNS
jgi:transposase-like protein